MRDLSALCSRLSVAAGLHIHADIGGDLARRAKEMTGLSGLNSKMALSLDLLGHAETFTVEMGSRALVRLASCSRELGQVSSTFVHKSKHAHMYICVYIYIYVCIFCFSF